MIDRQYIAEFLGTFGLVFAGTGAITIDALYDGVITHVGISAVFGLIVMAMIYSFGRISGAHINPAVTIGLWLSGYCPGRQVAPYLTSQFLGAVAASCLLWMLFPGAENLGATLPVAGIPATLLLEFFMTMVLMLVILTVVTGEDAIKSLGGLLIGATVGLCALFGGPATGASMNPARTFGPALVSAEFGGLWLYFLAPLLGVIAAVFLCRFVCQPGCCTTMSIHSDGNTA